MDSDLERDSILPYLEDLKISAFTKVDLIKDQVQNVTIGPNASFLDNESTKINQVKEVETSNQLKCNFPKNNSEAIEKKNMVPLIPFRQVLQEYEILRQRKVQEALQNHSSKFELFSAQQSIIRKQSWKLQQQKNEEKEFLYEKKVMIALKEYDEEKINERKRITQYEQGLEDERKKVAAALEAKKKENEMLKQCLDNQSEFQSIFQEIMMNMKSCGDDELKIELSESWKNCKELSDLMTALMVKCKESTSEQEKDMTEMVLKRMKELKNKIYHIIKSYQEKKQEQVKVETKINKSLKIGNAGNDQKPVTFEEKKYLDSPLNEYIVKSQLEVYTSIIDFHQKYVASFKELLSHENFKQFRFDCKKAVNLSVNTISAANSEHLHDKYMKLSNLLHGKNVIIGDLQITASKHPEGIKYCTDLLAKKFVLQGNLMVSGNPESAFSFATIMVSIWNESPEFGKILIAYFFKECTYLVPFYPPRLVDQTDQDYYESQGYRYADGKVEDQDKFLKRMTGTMRLYFAILLSSPNKNQNQHPYFMSHAWTWIVSVLKLKPRVDITATMFHTFFETVGFQMLNLYQKQFSKLMKYFLEDYFPSMKKIDSGGPVARLDCLIQEFKQNGNRFCVPKGLLSSNFW